MGSMLTVSSWIYSPLLFYWLTECTYIHILTGALQMHYNNDHHHTTTTVLRPFVHDSTTWVSQYQKKHSPIHISWSSSHLYQLLPSSTIHSILTVQFTYLTIFLHNLSKSSLVYLLDWSPPPHTPYISLPNQCLLFATHAHTIATCFGEVSILYNLFLVSLSTLYFGLYLLP